MLLFKYALKVYVQFILHSTKLNKLKIIVNSYQGFRTSKKDFLIQSRYLNSSRNQKSLQIF